MKMRMFIKQIRETLALSEGSAETGQYFMIQYNNGGEF